jgi:spermidine synthase
MFAPNATAFVANLCLMALEIIAGRIIARFLGFSIYTWTSVIGVVLGGLALGGYAGGRLADRFQPRRVLAAVLLLSAAGCAAIPVMNVAANAALSPFDLYWPLKLLLHVTIVFLPPSTCLGMAGPAVAKWALARGLPAGRTIGEVYAWSAIGSIAGTLVTGFVLIPMFGTGVIAWGIAAGLAALGMGFLGWRRPRAGGTAAILLLFGLGLGTQRWALALGPATAWEGAQQPQVLYERESEYSYIAVEALPSAPSVRHLRLDALDHGRIDMGTSDLMGSYQYGYIKAYAAVTRLVAARKPSLRAFCLGGGAYVIPRYIEQHWPSSHIEIAEIDPAVTAAAERAMGLPRGRTMRIAHMDARRYVDELLHRRAGGQTVEGFDVIYGDTFDHFAVPFHLTTKEFHDKLSTLLAEDGVYCLNVIGSFASGRMVGAMLNTLRQTFPHVTVFSTDFTSFRETTRNTFMFAASLHPIDWTGFEFEPLSSSRLAKLEHQAAGFVLTDEHAPVEHLLQPLIHARNRRLSPRRAKAVMRVQEGVWLVKRRRFTEAIDRYRQALELIVDARHPDVAEVAHHNLAALFAWQGWLEEAAKEYRRALRCNTESAEIHFGLSRVLTRLGRVEEAARHYEEATRLDPNFIQARAGEPDALVQGEVEP